VKNPHRNSDAEVDRLVNDNMLLAHFFHQKHRAVHWDDAQLLSACMDGLLQAAQEWDPANGVPFGSFAGLRIKWKTLRLIANNTRRSVKRGTGCGMVHLHLESPVGENDKTVADFIADTRPGPDTLAIQECEKDKAYALLAALPERMRGIVAMRFGLSGHDPMTLDEVGAELGLTRERVRQLQAQALDWMRTGRKHTKHTKQQVGHSGSNQQRLIPGGRSDQAIKKRRHHKAARYSRSHQVKARKAEVKQLLLKGFSTAKIAGQIRTSSATIAAVRKELIDQGTITTIKCGCGQPVGHRGRCRHLRQAWRNAA